MKRIIGGKRYDTDTAKEIARDWSELSRTDFGYWEGTLYQKRTGEYFIYGEGGPMSRYAVSCGQNQWSGGEKIIPVSYEAARSWGEEHMSADEYEEHFGEIKEDESRKVVSYSLPIATIEKVKRMAADRGASMSDVIADAIEKMQ